MKKPTTKTIKHAEIIKDMKTKKANAHRGSMTRMEKLEKAAMPLIKLLAEDYHPHHTAIVTATSVELLEGALSIPNITKFLKD